jgi:hypothetical protein
MKGVMKGWDQRPGVVYFFGAGDPPVAIKIGMTTRILGQRDLRQSISFRHKQIQSANHETIRLLGIICFDDGDSPAGNAQRLEQELHIRFKEQQRFEDNTPGHEWFTPVPALLNFIRDKTKRPEHFEIRCVISRPINRKQA